MLTHLETVGAADRGEVGVRIATEVELAAYISLIEVYSTVSIFAVVYLPS